MKGRLRHMIFGAWFLLTILSIVGGGQHVVHYMLAHEETHHYYENTCCKPDHSKPHIHEAEYCALCDVDVSVVLHADTFHVPEIACGLASIEVAAQPLSPTLPTPAFFTVRGPPAIA